MGVREFWDLITSGEWTISFEGFSLANLWSMVVEIVKNPSSNIAAAILLIAIVALVLLPVIVSIIYALSNRPAEAHEYVLVDEDGNVVGPADASVLGSEGSLVLGAPVRAPSPAHARPARVRRPGDGALSFLIVVAVFLALVVATGATTQASSVCLGCHRDEPHFLRADTDPHRAVGCVACHESGGVVASVTRNVPARVTHVTSAIFGNDDPPGYMSVTSASCSRCHLAEIRGTIEIEDRALRISHDEPLAAGAVCLDCHILDADEQMGNVTVGMSACLRCHNDEDASADCSTCHTGDVSLAVRAKNIAMHDVGRVLVPFPDCYSCHEPGPCDSCHGARLPHPPNYALGHYYDAAVDLWKNGGDNCFKCHPDAGNRSCYRAGCHSVEMPLHSADPGFDRNHMNQNLWGACDSCHNRLRVYPSTCAMCHPEQG